MATISPTTNPANPESVKPEPEPVKPESERSGLAKPASAQSRTVKLRRRLRAAERNVHGLWQILRAAVSTEHPLLAHLIPIRRCNLACTYCNEFDDFSKPVPTDEMIRRVDQLGDLS